MALFKPIFICVMFAVTTKLTFKFLSLSLNNFILLINAIICFKYSLSVLYLLICTFLAFCVFCVFSYSVHSLHLMHFQHSLVPCIDTGIFGAFCHHNKTCHPLLYIDYFFVSIEMAWI